MGLMGPSGISTKEALLRDLPEGDGLCDLGDLDLADD